MDILDRLYESCKIEDRIFIVNPHLTHQNFYSQQIRAVNLAVEIAKRHLIEDNWKIGVVGAGIAGRTIAAALCSLGFEVYLVDQGEDGYDLYCNASHRELHPNIIFWPFQRPVATTSLPFMNWAQGPAKDVVEALKIEWEEGFAKKINLYRGRAIQLDRTNSLISLRFDNGGKPPDCNICILAMGFAKERTPLKFPTPGYWSHGSVCDEGTKFLISGSGDGGLIDSLSPFLGEDVTKTAHALAIKINKKPIAKTVISVEKVRAESRVAGKYDSHDPCDFYKTFQFEPSDTNIINSNVKARNRFVDIIYKTTSIYSQKAAPINKLLVAHFSNAPNTTIKHIAGTISGSAPDCGEVTSQDGQCVLQFSVRDYDKILIRHGADPSYLSVPFLTPAESAKLMQLGEMHSDALEALVSYDDVYYEWHRNGVGFADINMDSIVHSLERVVDQIERTYKFRFRNRRVIKKQDISIRNFEFTVSIGDRDKERIGAYELLPAPLGKGKLVATSKRFKGAPRNG